MVATFFFFLKGLQTPLKTAGEEITSFKVVVHLKDGCVERKTQSKKKERVTSLYRHVWSKSFQMPVSLLSVVLDAD